MRIREAHVLDAPETDGLAIIEEIWNASERVARVDHFQGRRVVSADARCKLDPEKKTNDKQPRTPEAQNMGST